jgi:hypothetical protein
MAMKPLCTMRRALGDPNLFANVFEGESWAKWRVWLIACAGEKLTDAERVNFKEMTGRDREPEQLIEEGYFIAGRRSGKTRAHAVMSTWLSALHDHSGVLAPGERAAMLIASATQKQATKAFAFVRGIFMSVPLLKKMVIKETADTLSLDNGVDIEVQTASSEVFVVERLSGF